MGCYREETARRGAEYLSWSALRVRRCEAMISYSLLREAVGSVPRHAASSDMCASREGQVRYNLSGQGFPDVNQFDDELGGAVVNG